MDTNSEPLVSIICPVYNYEKYVVETIKSCLAQTYKNWEAIFVDDCSTDNSNSIIYQWDECNPGLMIRSAMLPVNSGYSACKNHGMQRAYGEFFTFIDADDMLTPDSLEVRMKVFRKHPELDIVHGGAYKFQGDRTFEECLKTSGDMVQAFNRPVHAQGVMCRRRVFERFGGFYEPLRSKSDKEMWFRLGIHEGSPFAKKPVVKAKKIKKCVAFYRSHPESMHHKRKRDPAVNAPIEAQFAARMKQLLREGITRENTRFLW